MATWHSPTDRDPDQAGSGNILPFQPRWRPNPLWLWFGVLGGPVAWGIARLATIYLASISCHQTMRGSAVAGLTVAQSLEVIVTIVLGLVACAAGLISWRIWRASSRPEEETTRGAMPWVPFWSLGGIFLSVVFLFAILVAGATTVALGNICPLAR